MDRLDTLKTFVAVADKRSFAEAARLLRISPTAASRAVAALERRLGVMLLRRTTRSVSPTPEGETFLAHSRHILDALDDAEAALRSPDATPQGKLIVTAPVVFGRMHVLPIILALMRTHPKLTVTLTLTDRVIRLVEEGVDVAVRIADLPDSALHAIRVTQVRRTLVASPDYLARHPAPLDVPALRGHDLITSDNMALGGEWRFASGDGPLRVEPRLLTNSVEAAIDAAVAGLGITRALSYQVEAHVAAGRLAWVLPNHDTPSIPVSLVFQAARRDAPNLRALVAAAKAYFAGSSRQPHE